jgi:hypothetical protein
MRRTKVLHREFQQHLRSELGKLSDMSTEEEHIIHVQDEEDGTPIWCVLTIPAMVLNRPKKADRLYEVIKLPIPLPRSLFQSVQALPKPTYEMFTAW